MQHIRNLVLDMDGVLWHGETPMPGLPAFFDGLRRLAIGYVMATNNATKITTQYVERFARFGVTMEPWRILCSAEVTALYLQRSYPAGTRVFVIGDSGLQSAMTAHGFVVVNQPDYSMRLPQLKPDVALVVAGMSHTVRYLDFAEAVSYINRGATFIGTNGDITFPTEIGPLPGAGSLLALLTTATGVTPTTIGKPGPIMFEEAVKRLGSSAENTAMVGDRLETDILGANNAELTSILVLSGIAQRDDIATSGITPDYIVDDIDELLNQLKVAHAT
ncbi:MAG: HAD-IIA family hydrolase [Anaerolineae bacterium]|nr:HAD-IIA family hydrolase [Anaerolineae bacterium]